MESLSDQEARLRFGLQKMALPQNIDMVSFFVSPNTGPMYEFDAVTIEGELASVALKEDGTIRSEPNGN